jgi:DNA-nicking Smr family endonuclease
MDIQMNSILHSPPIQGSNGLDKRTKEKLTKGKMPIEGRIDLHGMTQAEAKHQLTTFIQNAFAARKRCVLVVTGKGSRDIQDSGIVSERQERGILRARLSEWIYEPPLMGKVLSHVHATPRDGGSGAFYIYLKNQNKY